MWMVCFSRCEGRRKWWCCMSFVWAGSCGESMLYARVIGCWYYNAGNDELFRHSRPIGFQKSCCLLTWAILSPLPLLWRLAVIRYICISLLYSTNIIIYNLLTHLRDFCSGSGLWTKRKLLTLYAAARLVQPTSGDDIIRITLLPTSTTNPAIPMFVFGWCWICCIGNTCMKHTWFNDPSYTQDKE